MPQSFGALYVHFVWSTKERAPILRPELRPRLFSYCGGILRHRKCVLLAANGVLDHIHLLVSVHRTSTVSDLVRDVKADSSKWVHENFPELRDFRWQDGYGAFSVGHAQLPATEEYINDQEKHHGGDLSFKDEFLGFLHEHELPYDERYIWD